MSRTFRHMKSSKYRSKEVMYDWQDRDELSAWIRVYIDPKSYEGKRRLARFHASSYSVMIWNGTSEFIREYAQVPYRMTCKTELAKFIKDNDYEIVLESKPVRPYYW